MTRTKSKPKPRAANRAQMRGIDTVQPTPENARLYRPVDPNDPDVLALAESIREHGVREPLAITEDGYIVSGHRRWTAARIAGLVEVPCREESVSYWDADGNEIIRLLREYNRQRVKSLDEMLREEVVTADPDAAYLQLLEHRRQLSDMSGNGEVATIQLAARRGRSRISLRKRPMLDAVRQVIQDRREYWPLSDRQIHYVLLNDPPLRNSARPDSQYANDRASYGDLCDLLTRARLTGEIPWHAIADETRPTTRWRCHANAQDFIREELDDLFSNYARNLQRTQPSHIEIVAEKLTVKSIVESVASRYCLPVTIGRGYCSITPRQEMARRFRRSGKDNLTILALSDFDPDGENIAESLARSLRDDFDVDRLLPIKVARVGARLRILEQRGGCGTRGRSLSGYSSAARLPGAGGDEE